MANRTTAALGAADKTALDEFPSETQLGKAPSEHGEFSGKRPEGIGPATREWRFQPKGSQRLSSSDKVGRPSQPNDWR
jgi:hypothetical protein